MAPEFQAYQKEDPALEAVMRFHAVKRWHMIDTTRTQTLAEHSANVALLAFYIAKEAPGMFFGPSEAVAVAGLIHDVPEVFMGDIPTVTKPHLNSIAVKNLEFMLTPPPFVERADDNTKLLVKLCDLADGIRFIRNHGVDVTARHAEAGLSQQFIAKLAHMRTIWPEEVAAFVTHAVNFYAYEYR